jgi:Uma2 family endonuclease
VGISFETYERVALEDSDEQWELVCGRLRAKPPMTVAHNDAELNLYDQLRAQLDPLLYRVRPNAARLRVSTGSFYIPDLVVVSTALHHRNAEQRPYGLELYEEPMPLVVEVWSPSTGDYDVNTKLREYRLRADSEIWLVHPYERTVTSWRRQPDGSYTESVHRDGQIAPAALPGVRIDLATLFA